MKRIDSTVTERTRVASGEEVATKGDIALVRTDMEKLESRMTLKLYAAVTVGVGLIKTLDLLTG